MSAVTENVFVGQPAEWQTVPYSGCGDCCERGVVRWAAVQHRHGWRYTSARPVRANVILLVAYDAAVARQRRRRWQRRRWAVWVPAAAERQRDDALTWTFSAPTSSSLVSGFIVTLQASSSTSSGPSQRRIQDFTYGEHDVNFPEFSDDFFKSHQSVLNYTSGRKRPSVQTSHNATRWDVSNICDPVYKPMFA